ncbi:uncharacterized protein LOC124260805 [Haliotis rubra]|uniref:uncharacterized protein LOC124260805 n=1 Tax=Haliotis rubra TaxID=36100 RepID=UPI001EE5DF2E|nr:uncharacterized protein LOC124260805 [Haliotis rubra]
MAAAGKACSLCESDLGKKSYRLIDRSETLKKYMQELLLPLSGYLCNNCVAKFYRLEKIDFDIEAKVNRLRMARHTPTKGNKRMPRLETPTPKIIKKFISYEKPSPERRSRKKLSYDIAKETVDIGTQTRLQMTPPESFKIKCLTLMNHMGIATSQTSVLRKKKVIAEEHKVRIDKMFNCNKSSHVADTNNKGQTSRSTHVPSFEVLGDNIDILVSPGTMAQELQRKSWHWFLLVVSDKRLTNTELPSDLPSADIVTHPAIAWIPSKDDVSLLHEHQQFQVAKILEQYIQALSTIKLPQFIKHKHLEETSKKSVYHIADLIDESENSSEGMVKILQKVHQVTVAKEGIIYRNFNICE